MVIPILSCCSVDTVTDIYQIDDSDNGSSEVSELNLTITESDLVKDCNFVDADGNFGKYELYMKDADATIGISSSRLSPLCEERIVAYYEPSIEKSTKSSENHAYYIKINGMNIFSPSTKAAMPEGSIAEMFGKKVSFDLSCFGTATKSGGGTTVELNAPEIVKIESPTFKSEEDSYPLCYYKNFVVKWNPDKANTNGVVIIVKWAGTMGYGPNYPSSYVINTVCVPDSGTVVLDEKIFDNIPDAACCKLCVVRGDLENVDINGEKIRLMTESHDILGFILVRNISNRK